MGGNDSTPKVAALFVVGAVLVLAAVRKAFGGISVTANV